MPQRFVKQLCRPRIVAERERDHAAIVLGRGAKLRRVVALGHSGLLLGGRPRLGEAAESREHMGACRNELDLEPSEPLPTQRLTSTIDELQRAIELARARCRTS